MIGIELGGDEKIETLIARIKERGFLGEYLNNKPHLFQMMI